jgi:integrase
MIAKIGNRLISSLKPKDKPYQVHDKELRRFILRVQPTGAMTYYCNVDLPNGKRTTKNIGSHTVFKPAQARDEAIKILGDVAKGIDPTASKRGAREKTLKSYIEEEYGPWLKSRQKKGEEEIDAKSEARALATLKMIETSFADFQGKKLSNISPWVIEKWKMNAINKGAKPATINRKMDALRAAFSKAVKWEKLEKNPFSQVEWCELDDNSVVRYLTDEEAYRLESALLQRDQKARLDRKNANQWRSDRGYALLPNLDDVSFADYLIPMVRLSRNLGLRRAELFHLELKHVDLLSATPTVTIVGDNSKNGKTRHIPLNQIAFQTIKDWISQNHITQGLLFPSANGGPMNNVNKSWKAILKQAQINNFRWHDMRHDFASRLVMSGVDLNTVRELLGHGDLKMSLRYAHLSPKIKAEAVARLNPGQSGSKGPNIPKRKSIVN